MKLTARISQTMLRRLKRTTERFCRLGLLPRIWECMSIMKKKAAL
nr:MAG TPA: hypothetical protein [Caudoviricetes sp.]